MTTDQNTRPTPSSDVADWRYSINYGPEGEANYANVYDGDGVFVGNLKTHHAIAIVRALSRLSPPAQVEVTDEMVERIVSFVEDKVAVVWARPGSRQYFADELRVALTAALTATDAKPVVPAEPVAGWKLVPVEPTEEMIDAAANAPEDDDWVSAQQKAYKAMLDAAPAPPSHVEGEVERQSLADLESALLACEDGATWADVLTNYRAVRRTVQSLRARLASEGKTDA